MPANPLASDPSPADYWKNIVLAQTTQMNSHHDAMADLKAGTAPTTMKEWIDRYGFMPPGGAHFFEDEEPAPQSIFRAPGPGEAGV